MSQAAEDFLNQYWDGKLPVNMMAVCKKAGIAVYAHDLDEGVESQTGLLAGKPCIRIRRDLAKDLNSAKLRFILAHCAGHIVLHRDQLKEMA